MSKQYWLCVSITLCLVGMSFNADAQSPYAGLEERQISALSQQQINQLLNGEGMGFALSAELNGYPGPKHVLELKSELALSQKQLNATLELFDAMNTKARHLGNDLVSNERKLDELFRSGKATSSDIQAQVDSIAKIRSKLRGLHLTTHLTQINILTAEQNHHYQKLRGYLGDGKDKNPNDHTPNKHQHDHG